MPVVTMRRNFTSLIREVRDISYKNVSVINTLKTFKRSDILVTSKVTR